MSSLLKSVIIRYKILRNQQEIFSPTENVIEYISLIENLESVARNGYITLSPETDEIRPYYDHDCIIYNRYS